MIKAKTEIKKYIPAGVMLALFLGSAGFFPTKKNNFSADTVNKIAAQFPAESNERQYQLAGDIFALGSKAVKIICMGLDAPGEGRDTPLRFALSGMASYTGRIENEKERRMFVDAVADSLQKHPDKKAKPFLIQMLQQTGRHDAVKPLQRYLRDPDLCGCTARALQTIGTPFAEKILRQALSSAPVTCRAILIKHLGEFRTSKALKKIMEYASHSNPELRQAALFALANSGSLKAEEILLKSHVLASPIERAEAPHLLLLYARRAAENGRSRAALELANRIIRNFRAPQEIHVAAAALSLIVDLRGKEALSILLEAADNPDPKYRGQAYRLAADFSGKDVTEAWIQKAGNSPPALQAEIITMLAGRRDPASVHYIHHNLNAEDALVRKAAFKAAADCGEEKMLPDLIRLLSRASDDELAYITQALLRMPADLAVTAAVNSFENVPPEAQVSLMHVLSARRARTHSGLVFSHLQSQNEKLRHAAFLSLENMVSASDIGRLVDLMFQLKDRQKISLVQKALAASANRISELEDRAAPIINALEKAEGDKRIDFLRPLAQIGGRKALKAVLFAYRNDDIKMKTAAVYTLSEWPEFTAVEHLLNIAQKTKWRKNRYLALQGFTRLVTESEISPSLKSDWMKKAIDLPQNDAEAKVILSGLSRIKSREALNIAEQFYGWSGLEKETAWAVVQIILPAPEKEGVKGADLIPHLQKTLEIIENEYDRERILRYIETLHSARANVTARISRAPDCSRIRPHSWSVAPVV
jgi:HEAT repeat protein